MINSVVKKQIQWDNLLFLATNALIAIVAAPLYILHFGVSLSEWLLFAFYVLATGYSITIGYHRLYAHATFKAHPIINFFVLFFGAAAFEYSALKWTSQHRYHHQYVDTYKDPYNIKKGFFYAHIGWLLFWNYQTPYKNVSDLKKNKLLMHQHKYLQTWSFCSGFFLPLLIGALTGHLLGAFLISVCLRVTLIHHSTFSINSVCHTFGKATYDIYATAKDHWLVAFFTNGEGYHNFHHRFPTDYRNGFRWYHWDPSKWIIAVLAKLKLVTHLRRASPFRILEARLFAEKERTNNQFMSQTNSVHWQKPIALLNERFLKLKQNLTSWDNAIQDYKEVFCAQGVRHSRELKRAALSKIQQTKCQFKEAYAQWSALISLPPLELQNHLACHSGADC